MTSTGYLRSQLQSHICMSQATADPRHLKKSSHSLIDPPQSASYVTDMDPELYLQWL